MAEAARYERHVNITGEEIRRNIYHSLRFPQFQPGGASGAVVVCAAGSSLLDSIPLVKALYGVGIPVCAVKGTAGILIENDIIPTYVVSMDGKPDQARFFTNPHPDIEYLIAGQSDRKVFDALTGYRVTVWHGEGKAYLPTGINYILGGSTSGSRSVSLMWAKGFTVHHLVGFDCCELNDETHVYDTLPKKLVDVYMGDVHYRATGQMIYQYQEFFDLFRRDPKIEIVVHGNGMLAKGWELVNQGKSPNLTASRPLTHAIGLNLSLTHTPIGAYSNDSL